MTIERPMFPPRADSVDSFSHQPAVHHRPEERPASDSPKPAVGLSRRMALAGLATLTVGLSATAAEPDPVFAAIERHRALSADYTAAVDVSSKLDVGPEFEAADAIAGDRCDALLGQADILIRLEPTTTAGAITLMRYFASLEEWQTRDTDWLPTFLNTLASALEKTTVQG
jgi:hypothetical protein